MPIIFGMCSGMLLVSKTCLISQKNPEFKKFQLTKLIWSNYKFVLGWYIYKVLDLTGIYMLLVQALFQTC